MNQVSGFVKDPSQLSGIADKIVGAVNSEGGKEQLMGFVHQVSNLGHSQAAQDALHSLGDQLKNVQGVEHLGDALKHAVAGDQSSMMEKLTSFASQHGVNASQLSSLGFMWVRYLFLCMLRRERLLVVPLASCRA
jgi:hypothetical protein